MNLIQKLESDISQAAEYGGIPNYYSRAELRKFLAALKIADQMRDQIEELTSYSTLPEEISQNGWIPEGLHLTSQWDESITL